MDTKAFLTVGDFAQGDAAKKRLAALYTQPAREVMADAIAAAEGELPDGTGEEKHDFVFNKVMEFVEAVDDSVALIPHAGAVLGALVDIPAVDAAQEQLAAWLYNLIPLAARQLIESVFRALFKT